MELGYVWADEQGQVMMELDTTKLAAGDYTVIAHGNTSTAEATLSLAVASK